jgi:hypothetical protein
MFWPPGWTPGVRGALNRVWRASTATTAYNFCFMKLLPSITDFPQTLFRAPTPGLGSRLGLGCLDLTKMTTGKEYYTVCKLKVANESWKWLTMAPEAHGPRSFQIRILGPKIWSAPTKTDLPYNFCFIKFFSSLTVAAVEALQTLFRAPPDPGGPPRGWNIAYDLALVKLGPHTKFGEDWSNGPAVHWIQTNIQLDNYILHNTHNGNTYSVIQFMSLYRLVL